MTVNGKEMPVNAEPSGDGNLVLVPRRDPDRPLVLTLTNLNDKARAAAHEQGVPLYISHFATCPDAEKWRQK